MTTLTVRPLSTPYDPASSDVTVATPSCCCCCCCCLATLGTAVGFAAGATYETAVRRGRPRVVPTLVAVLALPLALVTLVVLLGLAGDVAGTSDGPWEELAWVAAGAVYVLLTALPLTWAGAHWFHSVSLPVLLLGAMWGGVLVEIPLALVTALVLELGSPAFVALGVWIGRGTHSTIEPPWPQPPGLPVVVGCHHVPPPPPDAVWGPPVHPPALPPVDGSEAARPGSGDLPALPAPPAADAPATGAEAAANGAETPTNGEDAANGADLPPTEDDR